MSDSADPEPGADRHPADRLVRALRRGGIDDERVLDAIRSVPRDAFVPESMRGEAWANHPLPIGHGQTISQPYVVALMTQLLEADAGDRILEVGTGSGYQTAILARLGYRVFSVERVPELARRARKVLERIGAAGVEIRVGDGWKGWPEHAPYDGVIVTAAPERVPPALVAQLAPGGRLVVPVGPCRGAQSLEVITRDADGEIHRREVGGVRFVPLVADEEP